MRRVPALVGMTTPLALAGVGCGGGGSSTTTTTTTGATPAVEWADGFCTAVTSWKDELTTIGESLVASPTKDGLQQAADGVKSANQTLTDDLAALGTPATPSGQKVKTSVDDLTTSLDAELAKIESAVKNVSGISDLLSTGAKITASLAAMQTAFSNARQSIDDADVTGEMKTAFDQASSCSSLRSSSG